MVSYRIISDWVPDDAVIFALIKTGSTQRKTGLPVAEVVSFKSGNCLKNQNIYLAG